MNPSLYAAHVKQNQQNWETTMAAEGFDSALIHSGSPIVSFLDDHVYPFRPNPHFLAWLPLGQHSDSVLLVRPGRQPVLWYYQPEDYWHLPPADPEAWWADQFEVRVVTDPGAWKNEIPGREGRVAVVGDSPELSAEFSAGNINPQGLITRLHLLRTRKTDYELGCMRAATQAAVSAHRTARDAFLSGCSEFEIHLAYLRAAAQNDFELPYNSIVALNEHSAVLHYQGRDRRPPDKSRSFLIDAGATCHTYAADITRTYAGQSGDFARLVAGMEQLELDLAAKVAPGVSYPELHLEAHRKIADLLQSAGITRLPADDAVESGLSGVFFPHGLGHFIGLQTHDVAGLIDNDGQDLPRPDGHPFLRLTRVLEPGNVLTIEPGLYFIPALLAEWKATGDSGAVNWDRVENLMPFGGIRIEDNVHVTESGNENLTRNAFGAA